MATLKSLSLSGWKSIRQAQIDFGRVTVLIGANGSGKSNFISFFRLLNEMIAGRLQEHVARAGGANCLLHYGSKTTPVLEFELVASALSEDLQYKVRLADSSPDAIVFAEEQVRPENETDTSKPIQRTDLTAIFLGQHRESLLGNWTGNPSIMAFAGWARSPVVGDIIELLRSCRPYHINDTSSTALIRRSGYIEDNHALRPDAANLAAVLYRIRTLTPEIYRRIVGTIRQINPRFGDFDLKPIALSPTQIMLNWREKGQDMPFGPHQLSDGTLRAMALVTLLLQPEADLPALLIIDEPELGLHPTAIGVIATLIRMASHHCQVIVATQSPQLLTEFEPAEVVVVDRRAEETTFSRLDEAGLAAWLEDYTLGELWQKNVLGGGPH